MITDDRLQCKRCNEKIEEAKITNKLCPKCGEVYNKTEVELFKEEQFQTSDYHISQIRRDLERLIGSLRVYNFLETQFTDTVKEKASWLIKELQQLKNQL